MTRLISPIYTRANGDPPQGEEARRRNHAAFKKAWHEHGLAVINPDDVLDDWEKQTVINIASRLYGKRGQ